MTPQTTGQQVFVVATPLVRELTTQLLDRGDTVVGDAHQRGQRSWGWGVAR